MSGGKHLPDISRVGGGVRHPAAIGCPSLLRLSNSACASPALMDLRLAPLTDRYGPRYAARPSSNAAGKGCSGAIVVKLTLAGCDMKIQQGARGIAAARSPALGRTGGPAR